MKPSKEWTKRGFTLVELMVVIAIIAVLIALLVPAVNIAIGMARNARIKLEIANLAQALERYKLKYGDYPPDFSSPLKVDEIRRHMARNFRYGVNEAGALQNVVQNLDPSEALYFWLRGFSSDPQRPLTGPGDRTPLFEFDPGRLSGVDIDGDGLADDEDGDGRPDDFDGDGLREYLPPGATGQPYLYFNHKSIGQRNGQIVAVNDYMNGLLWSGQRMLVRPYRSTHAQRLADGSFGFAEADKFQIISAGLDGEYGSGGLYPDGVDPSGVNLELRYTPEDRDNITNFIQGGTLEDDIP